MIKQELRNIISKKGYKLTAESKVIEIMELIADTTDVEKVTLWRQEYYYMKKKLDIMTKKYLKEKELKERILNSSSK